MIRRSFLLISMIAALLTPGCMKETYDMNMLSKWMHLSPTMAVSAIKGDVSLSDIVKSGDTVVFDEDNFVKIIFKKDSAFTLTIADFIGKKGVNEFNGSNKGNLSQLIATFDPDSVDFEIEDILRHITGTYTISNPIIRLNYSNSFVDPVELNIDIKGTSKDNTVHLGLAPFTLNHPDAIGGDVSDTYVVDKNNSSLPELLSMFPEKLFFSGTAMMNTPKGGSQTDNNAFAESRLLGSFEVEVPLEFRLNNLQFNDTTDDNFLADVFDEGSELNWDDFELFRIDFDVENGFPMGAALEMSLYKSTAPDPHVLSTIDATDLLKPAPVDASGKATGVTISSTELLFTEDFFNSIDMADKIILKFTLNTTDNGADDIKIYSDYRINFKASLVLKPDYKFNLK